MQKIYKKLTRIKQLLKFIEIDFSRLDFPPSIIKDAKIKVESVDEELWNLEQFMAGIKK